ncbi:unnamed protein product, partial [Meganyctiphanes norvegica]
LVLWTVAKCHGQTYPTTATGCIVYSLYDGSESKPWSWSVGTHAVFSLLPEIPGDPLRGLHITLNGQRQDHQVYFDQYDNVVCRDGSRQESTFHQTPVNASTQRVYQWYHAAMDWQGGVLSINGHAICSGMYLGHDTYNITLKYYMEANGLAAFGCHQDCPIWEHKELRLYNKPLLTGSAVARRKYEQQSVSISLIVDRCYSKLQKNCIQTIILNNGIGSHWTKLGWRNIVEVSVGDLIQSVDGHDEKDWERGMKVLFEDSSNVLWTFLTPTCTKQILGMDG